MRRSNTGLLGIVIALSACSAGSDDVTRDSPEMWSVSSEPDFVIGLVDGDPNYMFQRVARTRLLPDGGVAVADRGLGNVRVYGPDGSFRWEIGRPGEGPGEFSYIGDLAVYLPDTLVVYDAGLYRMTTISADGVLLETVNLRSDGGRAPEIFVGRFENGDLALSSIVYVQRDPSELTSDPMQFDRFSPAGEFASVLGTAGGMVRHGPAPTPFSPFLRSFVYRDSIYFTDGGEVLSVLGEDGAVARTLALPGEDVDYAAARTRLLSRLQELEKSEDANRLGDIPATSIPRVSDVLLDDEGFLWLKEYDPEEDSNWVTLFNWRSGGEWSVLDPDGRTVADIRLPSRFTPMDVADGRVAGVLRDDFDVQRVVVFSIARGSG